MDGPYKSNGVPAGQHKLTTSLSTSASETLPRFLPRTQDGLVPDPRDLAAPAHIEAWEKFVHHASHLVKTYCSSPARDISTPPHREYQSTLEILCGPGSDPAFDSILSNLARVMRDRPKDLVDDLIAWRSHGTHQMTSTGHDPQQSGTRSRATSNLPSPGLSSNSPPPSHASQSVNEDRRTRICTYVLLRGLVEVFSIATLERLGIEAVRKVQNIIFYHQLVPYSKDHGQPPMLEKSLETATKWDIAAMVWGLMSCLDFTAVQEYLLLELRQLQASVSQKGLTDKGFDNPAEKHLRQLLKGMRYTHLPSASDPEWSKACDFMNAIADLFANVHGQSPKLAYSKFVGQVLLPVAASVPSHVDMHPWRSVYLKLHDRLSGLAGKAKYAQISFPALAILNCVAPPEIFDSRWREVMSALPNRLRERSNRAAHLKSLCRLLWVRLRRIKETGLATSKLLEDVTKAVFFSGKRYYIASEPVVAEALIELVRIVADSNQDFAFRHVIFPLLNTDLLSSQKVLNVADLDPDKTVIGIRAFLAIAGDVERRERPPFPARFDDERDFHLIDPKRLPYMNASKSKAHARSLSMAKDERFSKPVSFTTFSESMRSYYETFCEALGKITRICNNSHGGEAVINQQVSSNGLAPSTTNLFKQWRDEPQVDDKVAYYDLLHTAIQALPQCPSPSISNIEMVTLLCFGVAHSHQNIARESAQSLASFARQGQAHLVVQRFTQFIFNYDTRYSTLSDSGMLGPDFVEQTLGLYVLLLHIWIDEVLAKARGPEEDNDIFDSNSQKAPQLDISSTWALVDNVEAHGLLFLCSPSSRVRTYATQVLELVPKFDEALSKQNARIYQTLERTDLSSQRIDKDILTTYERSILDRRTNRLPDYETVFIRLCKSADPADCVFWNKIFPHLARAINEDCPVAVAQTRNDVCARLVQMQHIIEFMGNKGSGSSAVPPDAVNNRLPPQQFLASNNVTIDQWRNYLTFACATLNSLRAEPRANSDTSAPKQSLQDRTQANGRPLGSLPTESPVSSSTSTFPTLAKSTSSASQSMSLTDSSHTRSGSKSSGPTHDSMDLGNELLTKVPPLLYVENALVRDAASTGLGSINKHLFRPLVESLVTSARRHDDAIDRAGALSSTPGSVRRTRSTCTVEVAQVYSLTAHYLREPEFVQDDFVMESVTNYVKTLLHHLRETEHIPDIWRLRRFFCDLVEQVFRASGLLDDNTRFISFQSRKVIFITLEEWYSSITGNPESRKDRIGSHDRKEMGKVAIAALSAMSAVCAGPLTMRIGGVANSFSHERILDWADGLLNNDADKQQKYGQQALVNVILHNKEYPMLIDRIVRRLYMSTKPKAIASYLDVLGRVVAAKNPPSIPFWKVLGALLFVLGSSERAVRMHAARMLRRFDEGHKDGNSRLRDLDISISDKTTVVYKKAQFEIASKLAETYPGMATQVFSELSQYFVDLSPEYQRNMVSVILPWLRKIELLLTSSANGIMRPTDDAYMVMANLLQITVRCGKTLHTEVQALWQTLVTGEKKGNLKLIIDFVMELCLDRRDQTFLDCAKQVVVYLATAKADQQGSDHTEKVISTLLLEIKPKAMVGDARNTLRQIEAREFPFVADLAKEFPLLGSPKLSPGHVSLVLLVDLIVLPLALPSERLLNLLVAVFTLWDQESEYFREQVREMLVHLIQSLVISYVEGAAVADKGHQMEALVDLVRVHDHKVTWSLNEGLTYTAGEELPTGMSYLVPRMLEIFEITHPTIRGEWAVMTLNWAVECAVPHLACRSLQLHRCCLQEATQAAVSNVLVRLAATASDSTQNLQQYSTELLRVCRQMVTIKPLPAPALMAQIFWATCATLDSAQEMEYREALTILELILPNLLLHEQPTIDMLLAVRPSNWEWGPHALTGLVFKGINSSDSYEKSLAVLNKLIQLPSNEITGQDTRLPYVLLANLPSLIHFVAQPREHPQYSDTANVLAKACADRSLTILSGILEKYPRMRFKKNFDFLTRVAAAIKMTFFPSAGGEILRFLMGMLSNPLIWIKQEILVLEKMILLDLDVHKIEFGGQARDVLWPVYLAVRSTSVMTEALDVIDLVNEVRNDPGHAHYDIYGEPLENGWSVPEPASVTARVRGNLQGLYDKFNTESNGTSFYDSRKTPEMGRPQEQITDTDVTADLMTSDQVMATLEELDDFFDVPGASQTQGSQHRRYESRTSTGTRAGGSSGNAFQHSRGLSTAHGDYSGASSPAGRNRADSRPTPPREAVIMSPSAFSASPRARPGMGPRSVTSPPGSIDRTPPGRGILPAPSPDEGEVFSDDDILAGRTSTSDQSFNSGTIRASSRTKTSFKSGVRSLSRRLTGGKRTQLEDSPEVPQIPKQYIPQSSEL